METLSTVILKGMLIITFLANISEEAGRRRNISRSKSPSSLGYNRAAEIESIADLLPQLPLY